MYCEDCRNKRIVVVVVVVYTIPESFRAVTKTTADRLSVFKFGTTSSDSFESNVFLIGYWDFVLQENCCERSPSFLYRTTASVLRLSQKLPEYVEHKRRLKGKTCALSASFKFRNACSVAVQFEFSANPNMISPIVNRSSNFSNHPLTFDIFIFQFHQK